MDIENFAPQNQTFSAKRDSETILLIWYKNLIKTLKKHLLPRCH